LRVLIVTPHVFAGGAEKGALNLAYHLNLMGCDVSIATLSLDLSKLSPHLNKLHYILPEKQLESPKIDGFSTALTSMLRELHSLVRVLRTCSDDFDLLNVYNFPSYWATYFAENSNPVIWTCSEVLGPYGQTKDLYDRSHLFRLALRSVRVVDRVMVDRSVETIVTCSEFNRHLIKERYGRDSMVIHTGVDYDFFRSEVPDAKNRLELGDGLLLLQVGSLIQRKNQISSIRALKMLKRDLGCVMLVIVGEGPWKPILQEETRKLQLEENVIFTGKVSEDDLRHLYHACDVNLFPGKDQTWGLVPFEALAARKPSIVAEGCGAAEIMGQERIGFVVNPSVEDLVSAVNFILRHHEYVEDLVSRGQKYVADNLNWERYARDMYGVFRDMLESKPIGYRIR
jgi:glycosyltransferase involved in cell wall biosynthesis